MARLTVADSQSQINQLIFKKLGTAFEASKSIIVLTAFVVLFVTTLLLSLVKLTLFISLRCLNFGLANYFRSMIDIFNIEVNILGQVLIISSQL